MLAIIHRLQHFGQQLRSDSKTRAGNIQMGAGNFLPRIPDMMTVIFELTEGLIEEELLDRLDVLAVRRR